MVSYRVLSYLALSYLVLLCLVSVSVFVFSFVVLVSMRYEEKAELEEQLEKNSSELEKGSSDKGTLQRAPSSLIKHR